MTGLQVEHGGSSLEIRYDVMSHLMQAGLSGTEWSLVLAVIQRSSCRGKKAVQISLGEFHELVRLDQEAIRKGLKTLRARNILIQHDPPSFTQPASWSFNEGCETWVPLKSRGVLCQHTPPQSMESPVPARRRVPSQHTVSAGPGLGTCEIKGDSPLGKSAPAPATMIYIDTLSESKRNKSTSRVAPSEEALSLADRLRSAVRNRDPGSKAGRKEDLTNWARDIDLLIRVDLRTPEEIRRVIDWCQVPGGFWGPNILSGRKLREKFDTLSGQMSRETGETRYGAGNGHGRIPQILNNKAERGYVPIKEPVRI